MVLISWVLKSRRRKNDVEKDMNVESFVKVIKQQRSENKNKWFCWSGEVEGHLVQIKCYNTYLQIYRIDGVDHASGCMDMKVSQFNAELVKPFGG